MKHFLLLLSLSCLLMTAKANQADSLKALLPTVKDTLRVQVLNNLCFDLAFSDPETGKQYGYEAVQLAESIGYTLGLAKGYNRLGIIYDITDRYDSSMYCYQQAGIHYAQINNIKGKASTLSNIGLLYASKGQFRRALGNYFAALKLFEQLGNPTDIAGTYNNIGSTYTDIYQYKLAFFYYRKAAAINEQNNNLNALASNYTNMASALRELRLLDSALYYAYKSLPIQQKMNNDYDLALTYNVLGTTYSNKGEHFKSIEFLLKALAYRTKVDDQSGINSTLLNLSGEYSYIHNQPLALEYAHKAHNLALQRNNFKILRKTAMLLFYLYTENKQFEKATQYVDLAMRARDSVLTEETTKQIAEMEVKYQSEKQAFEIENQKLSLEKAGLEIDRKQSTILLLVIVSIMIFTLGFAFYKRYQFMQQQRFDAQLILQQEQRTKAIIEAEEKERIRIARELHDGIGQQLSAAKMNLSAFEAAVQEKDKDNYNLLLQLVDDAVKEVRSISHNMMPNALIRSGLVSAVRDFINKLSTNSPLKIDLSIIGLDDRLEATTESVIYRLLQESISNVIKHSEATTVSIQLIKHPNRLNMVIEDNGKGFDTTLIMQAEGIGLKNMVSRVQFLNGTIDFDSTPGKGTTVLIDIPTS